MLVMIALALIVVVAAAYTLASVGMNMSALTMTKMALEMPAMAMKPVDWSISYALIIFLMWCLMMVAMMVPSAAPMVLIHAAIGRKQEDADRSLRHRDSLCGLPGRLDGFQRCCHSRPVGT